MRGILEQLNELNALRCEKVFKMPLEELKLNELSNMVSAEAGELSGICHKIEMDCYPHTLANNRKDLEDEVGDVLITLHLLCVKADIDLLEVTARKFNEVSLKKGAPSLRIKL